MKNIANFLFEAGMLKRTPRTGYQFLGSGSESVAEHIFRTIYIGYALGRMAENVDVDKIVKMCMFHDLPEARTGDQNYVNKKYVSVNVTQAVDDMASVLPFGKEISALIREFEQDSTEESHIARDADQIDFILSLKEWKDIGNAYAEEWLEFSLKRLRTEKAKEMAKVILETDSSLWWFADKSDWWIRGGK